VEGGHGEREPGVEIRPDAMHDFLEMAHEGQHRQDCFHEDAILPLPPLTQFEVGGIPLGRMKGSITEDNHALLKLLNEPLNGVIGNIGRGTLPGDDQSPLIQHQTQFPPDNPALIWEAYAANLYGAA